MVNYKLSVLQLSTRKVYMQLIYITAPFKQIFYIFSSLKSIKRYEN